MDLNTLLPKLVQSDSMKSIEHDGVKLDRYEVHKLLKDNIEYKYDYFSFIGDYEIILSENESYYKVREAESENTYLRAKALLQMHHKFGWTSDVLYTVTGEVHPLYTNICEIVERNEKVPVELINDFFELRFSEPDWDVIHYVRQLTYKGLNLSYTEFPQFRDLVAYYSPIISIALINIRITKIQ